MAQSVLKNLPIYMKDEVKKPGLYLALYHGYKNEKERKKSDDWGANGPLIGPLLFCHGTYDTHLKLRFETDEDAKRYGFYLGRDAFNEIKFTRGGCLLFDGVEYGDYVVANFPEKG
jgi:hypothetical protein